MYHLGKGWDIGTDAGIEQQVNWHLQVRVTVNETGTLDFETISILADSNGMDPANYDIPIDETFPAGRTFLSQEQCFSSKTPYSGPACAWSEGPPHPGRLPPAVCRGRVPLGSGTPIEHKDFHEYRTSKSVTVISISYCPENGYYGQTVLKPVYSRGCAEVCQPCRQYAAQ